MYHNFGNSIFDTLVNIIQKLHDEFSGNDDGLKEKLRRLVRHAAITNKHRDVEVNNGPKVKSSMFVILPDYDADKSFLQKIEDLIKSFTSEGNIKVSRGGKSNEIVVISLETNLTPRYLQNVYVLKENYNRLMSSPQGKVARFETQLEDYKGLVAASVEDSISLGMLPSLYAPTDAEKVEVAKMLGKNAGRTEMPGAHGTVMLPDMPGQVKMPDLPKSEPQVQMYFHISGQNYGPYDYSICKQLKQNNQINEQTMAWQQGMAAWTPAGQVPELKMLFAPAMPPGMPPIQGAPMMPPMPPTM